MKRFAVVDARGLLYIHLGQVQIPAVFDLAREAQEHADERLRESPDDGPIWVRECMIAFREDPPVAEHLDEIEPAGGHPLKRESQDPLVLTPDSPPIAATKWPSAEVRALYTEAQWSGLQARSEREADG
jgi:hypothetical protein